MLRFISGRSLLSIGKLSFTSAALVHHGPKGHVELIETDGNPDPRLQARDAHEAVLFHHGLPVEGLRLGGGKSFGATKRRRGFFAFTAASYSRSV